MRPLPAHAPRRIGDYTIVSLLGHGAMGAVYLGRSPGGRPVAVKVAKPELAETPAFRDRFRREVLAARSIGGFWTAAVVDADPDAAQPWMATEYVPGPTLYEAIAESGPLPENAVRRLAAGLAEALHAIHNAGLVHRDLKPSNVILAFDGPRVIDFGIAHALEHSPLTEAGVVFGTPGYLSPEQVLGQPITARSDVFSLGAVLVFAATGTGPYGHGGTAALTYQVAHSDPDLSELPASLAPIVVPCLVRDPQHRPDAATVLELVGETSTPGTWLPTQVKALVEQRQTELNVSAGMVSQSQVRHVAHPKTLVDQPGPDGADRPAADKPPVIAEPTPPAADEPPATGVRFATSRAIAITWAMLNGVAALMAVLVLSQAAQVSTVVRFAVLIGCGFFTLTGLRLTYAAISPQLRLDIGPRGINISSEDSTTTLPWEQIEKVAIGPHHSRPWLLVWLQPDVPLPQPLGRALHRRRNALRAYPVSHERYRKRREKDLVQLRLALAWYGSPRYDAKFR